MALILRRSAQVAASLPVLLFGAWSAAALSIDGPLRDHAATALAAGWILVLLGLLFAVRPFRRAIVLALLLNVAVVAWWLQLEPRNDRTWIAEVEHAPTVEFDGDIVRIHNIRNFQWRSDTDFTPTWEDRTYDLSTVRAADLFFSNWGPPMIEHTIMSWEFADGRHLAISIETRKEVGEEYSAVLGFFRQFELYYVVADERDVIGVRTNVRGEHTRVYRLSASPERARALLVDYLQSIQELSVDPAWYNAMTQNCTTTIVKHARHLDSNIAWDWRLLANGSADSLLYLRGSIDNSMPIQELKRLSDVTEAAKAAGRDENFSARIRDGLPRMKGWIGSVGPARALGGEAEGGKTPAIPGTPAPKPPR